MISHARVSTDPAKIQAIAQWLVPTTVKELRRFWGLAGYYRKFIRHFQIIVSHSQLYSRSIAYLFGLLTMTRHFRV
jgi:hypothetical protein